jgi:hypothetical protein
MNGGKKYGFKGIREGMMAMDIITNEANNRD